MQHADHFKSFMTDVVNINTTRLSQLDASVSALKEFLKGVKWDVSISSFFSQGSWAHGTIIKPIKDKPFDADLLMIVEPVDGWEAKQYIDELYGVFKESGVYKDKVVRYSHCVTIEYAGERRVDVAPCVLGAGGVATLVVCNRRDNIFELSEPKLYTEWLVQRNKWTGGNGLKKVTRLLKFLRDVKQTFSCQSFLFTTLIGGLIRPHEKKDDFRDIPTALRTIIGRLDDWLQLHERRPAVVNPVLCSEVLSDVWSEKNYETFRKKINDYRGWVDDAYDETDRDESLAKWRRVFGDDFARSAVAKKALAVSDSSEYVGGLDQSLLLETEDLVDRFHRLGKSAIPDWFDRLPYKERPRWAALTHPAFDVYVGASLHVREGAPPLEVSVAKQSRPLPRRHWLQFRAYREAGAPLGGYRIFWRITNTDREAYVADCLRGEFYGPSQYRWERLLYRGVHSVEAFVIREADNVLVAWSEPYYVSVA